MSAAQHFLLNCINTDSQELYVCLIHYLGNILVEQVDPIFKMKTFSPGVQRKSVKEKNKNTALNRKMGFFFLLEYKQCLNKSIKTLKNTLVR